jgi:hypothetical protein
MDRVKETPRSHLLLSQGLEHSTLAFADREEFDFYLSAFGERLLSMISEPPIDLQPMTSGGITSRHG